MSNTDVAEIGPRTEKRTIRLSKEEERRAERAAAIESARLGRVVNATSLVTDIGMDGINQILQLTDAADAVLE